MGERFISLWLSALKTGAKFLVPCRGMIHPWIINGEIYDVERNEKRASSRERNKRGKTEREREKPNLDTVRLKASNFLTESGHIHRAALLSNALYNLHTFDFTAKSDPLNFLTGLLFDLQISKMLEMLYSICLYLF